MPRLLHDAVDVGGPAVPHHPRLILRKLGNHLSAFRQVIAASLWNIEGIQDANPPTHVGRQKLLVAVCLDHPDLGLHIGVQRLSVMHDKLRAAHFVKGIHRWICLFGQARWGLFCVPFLLRLWQIGICWCRCCRSSSTSSRFFSRFWGCHRGCRRRRRCNICRGTSCSRCVEGHTSRRCGSCSKSLIVLVVGHGVAFRSIGSCWRS